MEDYWKLNLEIKTSEAAFGLFLLTYRYKSIYIVKVTLKDIQLVFLATRVGKSVANFTCVPIQFNNSTICDFTGRCSLGIDRHPWIIGLTHLLVPEACQGH